MYLDAAKKQEIFGKYGKSNTDTGSAEAQVALFSYRISHLTEHMKLNRKDYSTERALTMLVGKRRRLLDYLKANVPNLTFVNADQACSDIGSSKVLNMVLLGAAIRTGVLDFTISEIESIMKQTLPEKFHEMNLRALNYNI